jgi:hypothetical protein
MSLLAALTKLVDDELAQEGITPQLLAMIDLSVAYSLWRALHKLYYAPTVVMRS